MKSYLLPLWLFSLPRRNFLTKRSLIFLAGTGAAAVLFAATPAGANEASAVESGDQEENSAVVAVLRAPAPRQLAEQITAVARSMQLGPQIEALPFIVGGLLGDPSFEGLSATENMGVVLLGNGDGDMTAVLLLKLTEESPLRESLPGFEMTLQDFGDWTFVFPDGVSQGLIDGQQSSLISAVSAPRRYDVEITADGPDLAQRLRDVDGTLSGMGTLATTFLRPMIEGIAAEAEAIRDFRIGLNLAGDQIEQVFYMQAVEGSPMAAFLDQKSPADLDFARFIRADEAVAFLGGFDVGATQQYFDHFLTLMAREGEGWNREVGQQLQELAKRYFGNVEGPFGGVMSFDGLEMQMASVIPSQMSDGELLEMLLLAIAVMERMPADSSEEELPMRYELLPNQTNVGGFPVHLMRSEVRLDPEQAAELEENLPGFVMPTQRQDMHYAIFEGYMINATSVDRIKDLIEAVRGGEPVRNNLASVIRPSEGNLFGFRVDLVRYFGGIMAVMMPPDMVAVLKELEQKNLKPMQGSLRAQGGEAEFRLSIPMDTLVSLYQVMTAYMASLQEQPGDLFPVNP